MQRMFLAAFVAATLLWLAGCSEEYVPAPRPKTIPRAEKPSASEPTSPPAPATAESSPAEPSEPAAVPESEAVEQPAVEPPAPVEPSPPTPPRTIITDRHSIELATGVALPQTGPEGTMMMFSVEYEFVLGEPNPKLGYVWVIERAKGAPVKRAVRLSKKKTLYTAVQRWRPENGPFRSHIEDRDGKRLSASIDML